MTEQNLLCLLVLFLAVGCEPEAPGDKSSAPTKPVPASQQAAAPAATPVNEIDCRPFGHGGETGDGFFGTLSDRMEAWVWDGAKLRLGQTTDIPPHAYGFIALPKDHYLGYIHPEGKGHARLLWGSPESREMPAAWAPPQGWINETRYDLAVSLNGKFVAAILQQDIFGQPPPNYDPLNPRCRVCLIDLATLQPRSVGELSGHGNATIRQTAVSDDGKYVAVGGWNNGVALLDASQGKVLWMGRPPTEVSTGYVTFSADGLTLYSAGSEGCVYTIDTLTGKITGQWWATVSGKSIYGHRISCLTRSPDGKWVAAGTGPEGHVYLFNTASPAVPQMLPHGLGTITTVTFSPDSKYLASVAGGKIKVWNIMSGEQGASSGTAHSEK
jgi:hypothetical protein